MANINHPLTELYLRNHDLLQGKDVVFAGDIDSMQVLNLAKGCKSAVFIIDNYAIACQCAAALGKTLNHEINQSVTVGFISVIFAPLTLAAEKITKFSCLTLFLSKAKQKSAEILRSLAPKLEQESLILIAGSNDGGGKSADGLLKECGEPYKVDTARKCTLFAVKPASPFSPLKACPDICYENLQLKQKYGVFSQGRVDEGTSLLLKNLPQNLNGLKALDLGCGCGIIGLYLAKKGASVTFSDISAEALFLAELNAKKNGLKESCEFKASFMLDDASGFDVIATNPPFHEGIKKAEKVTLEMIKEAPNHLNKGGALYLVGNSFLNYGPTLEEAFEKVTVIESNKRFSVFKASN